MGLTLATEKPKNGSTQNYKMFNPVNGAEKVSNHP